MDEFFCAQNTKDIMQEQSHYISERALREQNIEQFWKEHAIFEKTLDTSRDPYVFYDGPPFGTGLPHYGHILAGTIKDAIPRYQTMRGKYVPRMWGWDCHGLPVENLIEKKLNLETKKDIETYGIDRFNTEAQCSVLEYASEWKDIVPRVGRFVDMDHDYKTMDATYTESIWWSFAELHKKGLLYEGYKIMHLCPRCETTLSNFEVSQGYKDIVDISVFVKFELVGEPGTYMVAWTTTPWTLPGNVALALNKDALYVYVQIEGDEKSRYVIAKDLVAHVLHGKTYTVLQEALGSTFVGKSYTPPFDYYQHADMVHKENAWKIYHADFVTTDAGTGIAHEAPAFGAEDKELADQVGLPLIKHVGTDGRFKPEVTHFAGLPAKPKDNHQASDIEVIKYLAHNHHLFEKQKITHSYPHCWRCDTPLLNYASSSWFVKVTALKDKLIEANKTVTWIPDHLQEGRFGKWLEGARDWAISRSRYWGAPIPVWKKQNGEYVVINSLDTLKKHTRTSNNTYFMIRHGEAESNVAGIVSYQHGSVTPLTEKGVEQVKESAVNLKDKGITKIIASPFLRTKQTAEIIRDTLGLTEDAIVYDERLIDINAGIYEGRTWGEYFEMFHDASGAIDQRKRFVHRPEGGETLAEVKARVGACLYEVEKTYTNEKILFVGHGASLWMMQSVAVGADMEETIRIRYGANNGNYQQDFVGNATVRELSFVPLPHNSTFELDLHRPYIDTVVLVDESGLPMVRVPEVFDCWFESGSMPFASLHYMGDDTTPEGKLFRQRYPADFIAEGLDQTRGWFYSLMVLGVALFDQSPYKRVIVNGLILAEDGQKMSKRLKNYPDLMEVVNKHGADALRYYLLGSQVVQAEELRLSEKDIAQVASKVLGRLENVLSFYELYRDVSLEENTVSPSMHVLDQWIVARLNQVIEQVTNGMESYELDKALRPLDLFVDDISTWYLRRSRDRIKDGDKEAKQTLYYVIKTTARVLAPFTPFIAEEIWQKLKTSSEAESVHLTDWPENSKDVDISVLEDMQKIRNIVTLGLESRQKANIKVRQPLGKIEVKAAPLNVLYVEILKDELNVKEVEFTAYYENDIAISVKLDTAITPELKREGVMRELIRAIQDLRKTSGFSPDDRIQLTVETTDSGKSIVEDFKSDIMKTVGATEIIYETVDASEIVFDDLTFKIAISKIA